MYKVNKTTGDAIAVPQLVFAQLEAAGGAAEKREGLFQVALLALSAGHITAGQAAQKLHLPQATAEAALTFWEFAGLLSQEKKPAAGMLESLPPLKKRRKMTTREVVRASSADPALRVLVEELQRLYGTVVGESDVNLYVTLCVQDGYAPDMILLAASEAAASGAKNARYVEKVLNTWRQNGIEDCQAADEYLQQQAQRATRCEEVAQRMGLAPTVFTYGDKKKVTAWFEEYGFGMDMVDAARLMAGEKRNDVKYLNGIMKRWFAKGYKKPRDIKQGGEGRNLRVSRERPSGKKDLLQDATHYVPMKREGR